ncbi:peroxide stress protein YaaA [Corynebacterium aquatimens]|uniref:Cytoplasmic iron level regulating protein YaaA (DUF328/UPF0246 family) n=1 Tax=Corynebacterium aquatimens TaxID=1190508 RepID=A0A931E0Y3_9CORY|nr:peroxide stress protein YaaA [Corynebacterium aquatimens]MBG6121852.1 cytoplasmic iron level regulating protein YaaA (DUF328/UPF0246 family) [Corynebacterium aquatimens]WJY65610.1 hypothetical protein CAQUA_04485 [Corynebacterium aquatimens]
MLIVLPPSETKAPGGVPDAMDVSFPSLDPIRQEIMADLAALEVDEMMAALTLPPTKREEAQGNRTLIDAPVMPAIYRYTGVLYDALDAETLPDSALAHLAIGSALFGVARATDTIPRYRLSGGSKLPVRSTSSNEQQSAVPAMKARWGSAITDVLAAEGFVVDMRSGAYQQLGPLPKNDPASMTVRVESVQPDGSRKVVSHFNKHYKGELARVVAVAPDAGSVSSISDVADIAAAAGMTVEINGQQLTLVV